MITKTVLQELQEWVNSNQVYHEDACWELNSYKVNSKELIAKIHELIEKEKEQLKESYKKGYNDEVNGDFLTISESFEDYYKQNYDN